MDVDGLLRTAEAEHLDAPVLYDGGRTHVDSVVVERDDARWTVYLTDERAQPYERTVRTFVSEGDALEYALLKLRQGDRARRAMSKHPALPRLDGIAGGDATDISHLGDSRVNSSLGP